MPISKQVSNNRDSTAALRYAADLTTAEDAVAAEEILRHAINETMKPEHVIIFLDDPENGAYTAYYSDEQENKTRVFIARDSIIPKTLEKSPEIIIVNYEQNNSQKAAIESSLEDTYNSQLLIPILGSSGMVGWVALGAKQDHTPYSAEEMVLLKTSTRQFSVVYERRISLDSLQNRIHDMELLQQIDRELNASRDIDLALQVTLRAAIAHTHAEAGSIGLIEENFEIMENIWSILPEIETPILIDEVNLSSLTWLTKEGFQSDVTQSSDLSALLNIPKEYQWHFLMMSELMENQNVILCLHLDAPGILHQTDIQFLKRLNDHAAIALKNVLLYEELSDAIQTKNEFIGFISHELKNPLTVIKGYADILIRGMAGTINEEQRDYLITITHNVRRLNTFITDLSDQSHIETKSLRLTFESTPVSDLINDVLQSYAGQITKQNLNVETQLSESIPHVWCDRMRVIQILSNLVSNAVKYTPEGGRVILGTEHAQNEWDSKGAAEVVHFWVEDNGYGISPEDQAHMFEKFYRGTDDRIRKIPGTGLGLRISKSLAEMMGGKLWFTSVKGEGSTFHFTIPM